MPFPDRSFDLVVSALALNFVPDPGRAVAEFARVTASGGVVAAYVWDYAEGMAMMRYFWDAATDARLRRGRVGRGSSLPDVPTRAPVRTVD